MNFVQQGTDLEKQLRGPIFPGKLKHQNHLVVKF